MRLPPGVESGVLVYACLTRLVRSVYVDVVCLVGKQDLWQPFGPGLNTHRDLDPPNGLLDGAVYLGVKQHDVPTHLDIVLANCEPYSYVGTPYYATVQCLDNSRASPSKVGSYANLVFLLRQGNMCIVPHN